MTGSKSHTGKDVALFHAIIFNHLEQLSESYKVGDNIQDWNCKKMVGADLRCLELTEPNMAYDHLFIGSSPNGADLSYGIDLTGANLSYSRLMGLDLSGADLCDAILIGADLRHTIFNSAQLCGANLTSANLSNAKLIGTDLSETVMVDTILFDADLSDATLSNSNISNAHLSKARLISARLKDAIISGASLYGAALDDWNIDGIQCDYVYWDKDGKERTPKSQDFKPGEFEELYKSLPTITYYFSDEFTPITPLVMDKVVNEINQKHPQFELQLNSFHSRGTPHAVFTVLHKGQADDALKAITIGYEETILGLKGEVKALERLCLKYIEKPKLIQNAETIINDPGRIDHMGNTFNTTSGHDTNIATDQGTVKTSSQDVINLIDKTITESDNSLDDKENAKKQLDKMIQELSKPEPDKGRIKRYHDYFVGVIPKVAEVVPWGKLIEKTLGL